MSVKSPKVILSLGNGSVYLYQVHQYAEFIDILIKRHVISLIPNSSLSVAPTIKNTCYEENHNRPLWRVDTHWTF